MDNYGDNFTKEKKRKLRVSKYNHNFGDYYPGMQIGHKQCVTIHKGLPVPASMGWLWNVHHNIRGLKYRRGWQPGLVGKTIANMMTFKTKTNITETKDKKKRRKSGRIELREKIKPDDNQDPKPILKVQKKGDVFTIQVNPLKNLSEITTSEDPYIDCDPLVFKIIKKRSPEEQAKIEARKIAKLKKKRDAEIRKALADAAEDICKCAYMDVFCNNLNALDTVIESCPAFLEPPCICQDESNSSLSSNATWDIEYTPPLGAFDLSATKKKSCINVDTQYISADAGVDELAEGFKNKKSYAATKLKKNRKNNYPAACD